MPARAFKTTYAKSAVSVCLALLGPAIALFPNSGYADHDDVHFVVGYINHPQVNKFYKPLIERAYKQIGISVTFEKVGGMRGLKLLNEGMTDADVIRYDVVIKDNSNVIAIEPQLSIGASFLLCVPDVPCNKDIINKPDTGIAVTTRFFYNIEKQPSDLAANFYEFDDFYHVVELIKSERFSYAIAPSDFSDLHVFEELGFNYIPLVKHSLIHVINKKHLNLQPALSKAIEHQLAISKVDNAESAKWIKLLL